MRVSRWELIGILAASCIGAAILIAFIEPVMLAEMSNTWQYLGAFRGIAAGSSRDPFFPSLPRAPIHGGFLYYAALLSPPSKALLIYPKVALALTALQPLAAWVTARVMGFSAPARWFFTAMMWCVVIYIPPEQAEPFRHALVYFALASACLYRALSSGIGWWTVGAALGLTLATHLPTGVMGGLILLPIVLISMRRIRPFQRTLLPAAAAFLATSWPMLLQAAAFTKASRSWEGALDPTAPWTMNFGRMPVLHVPGVVLLPLLAMFLIAAVGLRRVPERERFPTRFWIAGLLAVLTLSVPPVQERLAHLLDATTVGRVTLIFPFGLAVVALLDWQFNRLTAVWWRRVAVTGAVLVVTLSAIKSARNFVGMVRGSRAMPPASGFMLPETPGLDALRGQVVMTDIWTAFVGVGVDGIAGVGYPWNHATTPPDAAPRRALMEAVFEHGLPARDVTRIADSLGVRWFLLNRRFAAGQTDSGLIHPRVALVSDMIAAGWNVADDQAAYLLLQRHSTATLHPFP